MFKSLPLVAEPLVAAALRVSLAFTTALVLPLVVSVPVLSESTVPLCTASLVTDPDLVEEL